MWKILNKCPICGGRLEYVEFYQYTISRTIKLNGEVSKKNKKKIDAGSLECGFIQCEKKNCDFITDNDYYCDMYKNIEILQKNGVLLYKEK